VLAYGERELAIKRIVAITSPGNRRSIRMLERLGMVREQTLELHSDGRTSLLFARNF
jgi:RimJ/RimL family protein N-acetyltransferase